MGEDGVVDVGVVEQHGGGCGVSTGGDMLGTVLSIAVDMGWTPGNLDGAARGKLQQSVAKRMRREA